MGMGILLLVLSLGIKNDLKDSGCNIDLGYIPNILTGFAVFQIIVPILYIVYILYYKDIQDKSKKIEKNNEDVESDKSLTLKSTVEKSGN